MIKIIAAKSSIFLQNHHIWNPRILLTFLSICLYESPMVPSSSSMPSPVSVSKPRPFSDKLSPNESSQFFSWTNLIWLWEPSNTIWRLFTKSSSEPSNPSMSLSLPTVVPTLTHQWEISKSTQSSVTSDSVPDFTVGLSVWNNSLISTVRTKK